MKTIDKVLLSAPLSVMIKTGRLNEYAIGVKEGIYFATIVNSKITLNTVE
jgi:hypothetical protein